MTSYDLKRKENESFKDYHVRLYSNLDTYGISSDEATLLLNKEYGSNYSESKWRKDYGQYVNWKDYIESKLTYNDELPSYKQVNEIKGDGTRSSDKLIRISEGENLDSEAILEAHGFNIDEFELVNAKNSIWNQSIDKTLYSSKITVKPKSVKFDINKLIEKLNNDIKVNTTLYNHNDGENMLVIPYFDMHFGIASLDYYLPVLNKTLHKIKSKTWNKILLISGQDALHNDNFKGQTSNGTIIDKVDMEKAWSDLFTFYSHILDEAILNSNSVDVVFSNGNHDQAMGWALTKALEVKYPQINFDSKMKQFKAYVWGNIFLSITHGDKANQQRTVKAILAEYGKLMTKSSTREVLTGHVHHQKTHDDFGIVYRTLGSGVPSDDYHKDNAFVGAMKQFQMLEYNTDYIEAVYYI